MSDVRATWHVVTPEYPPDEGGVADYVAQLAPALAASMGEVHVWCPGESDATSRELEGVLVHRFRAPFTRGGLGRLGRALDECEGPRVLLLEYVPHGFGRKGMNVAFARWVLGRRRRGDDVRVMFHEVAHPFVAWPLHHNLIAASQRWMAELLVRAATRVYVSIPGWEPLLVRLGAEPGSSRWTPVPSNVPDSAPLSAIHAVRHRLGLDDPREALPLVGHFGTYGEPILRRLRPILSGILTRRADAHVLLLGGGGERVRDEFVRVHPDESARITATGRLPAADVAAHLRACDLVVEPYPDGVSSRRSSVMAALANGVAVVTTAGRLTEPGLWSDGVALVPVDRPEEFVRVVLALLEGRRAERLARLEVLGRSGRRLYDATFSLLRTVSTLTDS